MRACLVFCFVTPKHFSLNFKADGYIPQLNDILFDDTHNEMPVRSYDTIAIVLGVFVPPSLHGSSGPCLQLSTGHSLLCSDESSCLP